MGRSYNSLGAMKRTKQDDYIIGICPVCNRRFAAECEHRTIESEQAYAVFMAAEQTLANERASAEYIRTCSGDDLGTHFIISGGEVLELDAHLESQYDEQNGDMDLPF